MTTDGTGAQLLERVGIDQPILTPDGGDFLAVINRNANPSKIDSYLHRVIDYDLRWDPESGATTSRVVVTMRNDAPSAGLPLLVNGSSAATPVGTNRTELSVLSPFDAVGAMLDGTSQPFGARDDVNGLRRYTLTVDLPPGTERTVIFDLTGDVDAGPSYRLRWYNQPLPNDDVSQVLVRLQGATFPDGAEAGRVVVGERRVEDLLVRVDQREET